MDTKLPVEIEAFAREYFAAEDRASSVFGGKLRFNKNDQKTLARRFKEVTELPIFESVDQLCKDLVAFRPGLTSRGHYQRLRAWAKRYNVKLSTRTRVPVLKAPFNFKGAILDNVNYALKSGVPLGQVREQSAQVLEEVTQRVKRQNVEPRILALLQETGMSKAEFASIVNAI